MMGKVGGTEEGYGFTALDKIYHKSGNFHV